MDIQKIATVDETLISQINPLLDEGTTWDLQEGQNFLSNPDNALFVAFWEGQAAGFLTANRLQRFDKRRAEVLLYEIGVDENFRQRGIAKALIQEVKKWAKTVGADEVWVLTNTSNKPAMALYKSAGGEEDIPGTTMFVYKLDK